MLVLTLHRRSELNGVSLITAQLLQCFLRKLNFSLALLSAFENLFLLLYTPSSHSRSLRLFSLHNLLKRYASPEPLSPRQTEWSVKALTWKQLLYFDTALAGEHVTPKADLKSAPHNTVHAGPAPSTHSLVGSLILYFDWYVLLSIIS